MIIMALLGVQFPLLWKRDQLKLPIIIESFPSQIVYISNWLFRESHNCKPTREQLTQNTTIMVRDTEGYRLAIKEALLILQNTPLMNR